MATERCPTGGLERAEWFRREAAEWDDAGNADRAAYCRRVATQIEQTEFASRPLLVLMGEARG